MHDVCLVLIKMTEARPSVTVSLFNCLCVQASCLLLSSQWTCVCDEGYVGNGHVCYGTVEQVSDGQVQSAGLCLCFQLTLFPGDFRSSASCLRPQTSSHG